MSAEALRALVGSLDPPMIIVTAAAAGRRGGCLVGFWTQCSIDPPRFLVCVSKRNATYPLAQEAAVLGVHILTRHDRGLAELFGARTADDTDKLQAVEWAPGPEGVPLLSSVAGSFVGAVMDRRDVGDHVAFLLEPRDIVVRRRAAPQLGLGDVKDMEPGHEA